MLLHCKMFYPILKSKWVGIKSNEKSNGMECDEFYLHICVYENCASFIYDIKTVCISNSINIQCGNFHDILNCSSHHWIVSVRWKYKIEFQFTGFIFLLRGILAVSSMQRSHSRIGPDFSVHMSWEKVSFRLVLVLVLETYFILRSFHHVHCATVQHTPSQV